MFSQYVPYEFSDGRDWNSHRDEVKRLAIETLATYCSNIPEAVVDVDVMGPPDIENMIGLHRGHIFQGFSR